MCFVFYAAALSVNWSAEETIIQDVGYWFPQRKKLGKNWQWWVAKTISVLHSDPDNKANASTVKNHLRALIDIIIDNAPPCRSARAAIMGFFCVVRFMNIFILICCCSVSTMLALSCSSCRSLVMVESVSSCRLLRLRCSSATCPVNRDTCGKTVSWMWMFSVELSTDLRDNYSDRRMALLGSTSAFTIKNPFWHCAKQLLKHSKYTWNWETE